MKTTTKIVALKDILNSENTRLFVRFQTENRYITGLLKNMSIKNNGSEIHCLFSENGNLRSEIIKREELVDVVVFSDANFNPVFLNEYETLNKMQEAADVQS